MKKFKGRRRNLKRRRQKLQFIQAPARIATWEYGQAREVPNSAAGLESRYFMTEDTDTSKDADTIVTRGLCCLNDIMNLANYAWTTTPTTTDPVVNGIPAGFADGLQGTLWVKGRDIYTIRNQTNESVTLQAFYCKVRKDWNQNDGQLQNVYRLLGRGFAERGYDNLNAGAFNSAMTTATISPFESSLFCRVVKIKKVEKFKIGVGQIVRKGIHTKWRPYTPIDYTTPDVNTGWGSLPRRYEFIKGESFILFKLYSSIGMVTGQPATQFSRNIGQTDPLVIMSTQRRYHFKHFLQPAEGLVAFVSQGIVAGDDVVIMGDNTKVEMKEGQAE